MNASNDNDAVEATDITRDKVERVAAMASIALADDEWSWFKADLTLVEESIRELSAVSVDGVVPTVHISDEIDVMRDDRVRPSLSQESALANAPKVDDDCFWVPRVLDV